jgi:hypothetical protein
MATPVNQFTSLARSAVGATGDLPGRARRLLRDQLEQGLEFVARPLTEIVVAALIEARVIDLVVARLLEAGVVERIVTEVLVSPDTEELVANTLERPELERLIVVAIESPATDRIVRRVLDSPGTDRTVTTLLESEKLQRIVEHIAESPEVKAAIAQQSLGLASSVAGEVRTKSVTADDGVERIVRRVLRRRQREQLEPPDGTE